MCSYDSISYPEFEGYTPVEMDQIVFNCFGVDCPVQLLKLSEAEYLEIPILNQIKYLINLIEKTGEIKLTAKGFLPTKIVSDLYLQGFLKDELVELGISKLYKETDSMIITLSRLILEASCLVKKRKNKLTLTKSSVKIVADNHELLKLILLTFAVKVNWAYFDGFADENIGQLGFGFTLVLLFKFGTEKQLNSFYAKKYFNAFPGLLKNKNLEIDNLDKSSINCYSIRTFDRFLDLFGLIKIEKDKKGYNQFAYISKTNLFDKLIICK